MNDILKTNIFNIFIESTAGDVTATSNILK